MTVTVYASTACCSGPSVSTNLYTFPNSMHWYSCWLCLLVSQEYEIFICNVCLKKLVFVDLNLLSIINFGITSNSMKFQKLLLHLVPSNVTTMSWAWTTYLTQVIFYWNRPDSSVCTYNYTLIALQAANTSNEVAQSSTSNSSIWIWIELKIFLNAHDAPEIYTFKYILIANINYNAP